MLKNKNIVVGVCGSVAIYKSLELIRLYKKNGANVRVILTQSAKQFIKPLLFEVISGNRVLCDDSQSWIDDKCNNHIEISKMCDVFVVAPISANTLNKLANGIGDNVLLDSLLACNLATRQVVLAPSANTKMLHNKITQQNIKKLKKLKYTFVSTTTKELICKDKGDGALGDIYDIFHTSIRAFNQTKYWSKKNVIINGGASIEGIDSVRYISNYSSGKMAISLACGFYYKGANVFLIGSEVLGKQIDFACKFYKANSTNEHLKVAQNIVNTCEQNNKQTNKNKIYFIGAGAMSDYKPTIKYDKKIKKQQSQDDLELKLTKTIDVIKTLKSPNLVKIGFKCEMDNTIAKTSALLSVKSKNLKLVCLNVLKDENDFGTDDTNIFLYINDDNNYSNKAVFNFSGSKLNFALALAKFMKNKNI